MKTLVFENVVKYAIRGKTRLSDAEWSVMLDKDGNPYAGKERGGQLSINGKNSLLNANTAKPNKAISIFKKAQE